MSVLKVKLKYRKIYTGISRKSEHWILMAIKQEIPSW